MPVYLHLTNILTYLLAVLLVKVVEYGLLSPAKCRHYNSPLCIHVELMHNMLKQCVLVEREHRMLSSVLGDRLKFKNSSRSQVKVKYCRFYLDSRTTCDVLMCPI